MKFTTTETEISIYWEPDRNQNVWRRVYFVLFFQNEISKCTFVIMNQMISTTYFVINMYDAFSRNTFRLLTGAHRSDAYFLKISNWDCLQYNIVALFDIFNGRFYDVEFSRANRCGTEYRREINGVSRFSRVTKSSPPYGDTLKCLCRRCLFVETHMLH